MAGDDHPWSEIWREAERKAVAFLDCRQEIPCNPCELVCRKGAITVGRDICSPPTLKPDLCDGCGTCVAYCPGMAVFLLDRRGGGGRARVTLPYEMPGIPRAGQELWVLDGEGNALGKGKVVAVRKMGGSAPTRLVTVEVPEDQALKVRAVKVRIHSSEEPEEVVGYRKPDYCLCRCEEVTFSRMAEILEMGFRTPAALRRFSRAGLGYCQGRYCHQSLALELAVSMGIPVEDAGQIRVRPPLRPVRLSRLGGGNGRDNEL